MIKMTAAQASIFKSKVMRLAHKIVKQMGGNRREVMGAALRQAWEMMKAKLANLIFVRKWVVEKSFGELNEADYYSKDIKSDRQKFSSVFKKVGSKFVILQGNTECETSKAILFSGYLIGKQGKDETPLQIWIPKSMMIA